MGCMSLGEISRAMGLIEAQVSLRQIRNLS